ncbi:MAG: ABC transporter permease [Bacteroidota bacterium]
MKNYITLFLRVLQNSRLFAFINLAGLTAGMLCVTLIIMFIRDEWSYDKHIPESNRIYRIAWFNNNPQTRTPHPMAQALAHDMPEVESAVTLSPLWGPGLTLQTFEVKYLEKDIHFNEEGVLGVDSTFFEVFSFPLVKGNPKTILRTPEKILISESTAIRYFGSDDPIGKRLAFVQDNNTLEVEGVFKDIPANTHFHFDFLVSYVHLKAHEDKSSEYYTWKDFGHFNYIKLKEGVSPKDLEAKLFPWLRTYFDLSDETYNGLLKSQDRFRLQPIEDIHLKSHIRWELEPNGNSEYIYILGGAALFILVIASLNFISLSTAKSVDRAKEIGVRKTLGADKGQLYRQFLGESLMLSLSASVLTLVSLELILPLFNNLTQKNLPLQITEQSFEIITILSIGLLIGIISGLYPAFHLSSLKPQLMLKGKFSSSTRGQFLQKVLVVTQFSLAMVLISGCFALVQQIIYLKNKPLGFDKEHVVVVPFRTDLLRHDFKTTKSELLKIPGVLQVSATSNIPGKQFNQHPIWLLQDLSQTLDASEAYVDEDLAKTLDIKLVAGRFFNKDSKADSADAVIINQTIAQQFNLKDPVGQRIRIKRDGENWERTIIGVMEDFHFQSLHQSIQPLIFLPVKRYNFALLKVDATQLNAVTTSLKNTWENLYAGFGFEYFFMDETINRQYQSEQNMSIVLVFFTSTGILITCMGLLGLAMINFKAREKEVGVRKVLGSSTSGIQVLLLRSLAGPILIALAIGTPFAFTFINYGLQNFTYHVNIGLITFAGSAIIVIVIALLTILFLVRKTSSLNPVDILKNE